MNKAVYIIWINYGSEGWSPIYTWNGEPILDLSTAFTAAYKSSFGNDFAITRRIEFDITEKP